MKYALASLSVFVFAAMPAQAAHWTVDYAKSNINFTVLWSGEAFSGMFKSWNADIDFDPADLAHSRAAVNIDITSEASGEAEFDDGLRGAMGFQVAQFPKAQFVTDSITHKSGSDYLAKGRLTLRGVGKTIMLPFRLTMSGNIAHLQGTAQVVRTDYGVGQGQWAAPDPVTREVKVTVDLMATRSP